MSAVTTPMREVRKLRFSMGGPGLDSAFAGVAQSPYTPFSGRRSGSIPTGTPQVTSRSADPGALSTSAVPSDSAEEYVNGGLDEALRSSSLDVLTVLRSKYEEAAPQASAAFVSEMLGAIEVQLSFATELMDVPSLHPYVRKAVRALHTRLLLEHATWILVETAWRPSEIRSRDLCTRRLSPNILDENSVHDVKGYVKCQRIVEWLERTADEALERSGGPKVKPLDDPAYRWEYTASRHDGEPVSMDYQQRGNGVLDEVERKAEGRLSHEIFRLVRAGRLEEAEEMCRRVGQPWRAAALAGGKRSSALSANGVKGDARRTWRIAAKAIATSSDPGIPAHERAVYGLFAGEIGPVLAVSTTFEDEAWARLSVLLDSTAQAVVEGDNAASVTIEDNAILQAFRECKHAGEGPEAIGADIREGIRMTRVYVGIGPGIHAQHISELLKTLSELSRLGADEGQEWICRFAAHVCIFMKMSGLLSEVTDGTDGMTNFDASVESYVQFVIQKDLDSEERARQQGAILSPRILVPETAARYLAELSTEKCIIDTYSKLLCAALKADLSHERAEAKRVGVSPREIDDRRTLCLQKAGQCFSRETLNSLVIAATDKIWDSHLPVGDAPGLSSIEIESEVSVSEDFSDADELVVRAIEFLIFPAFANYEEALRRVTKAARRFFLRGKKAAARYLISWFPSEIVSQISSSPCVGAVHELDSWRVYMDAIARHNEWNIYHSSRKPQPVSEKVRAAALAQPGEVSYETQASAGIQLQKYAKENEEFLRMSGKNRDVAVDSLKAALLFEGGWMQNKYTDEKSVPGDQAGRTTRSEEIRTVRKIGIPQLVVLLHHVYHESGMYSEAISLAQIIADEDFKLYENFGPTELGSFLTRIADSTVLFADDTIRSGECSRPYEQTLFEELPSDE